MKNFRFNQTNREEIATLLVKEIREQKIANFKDFSKMATEIFKKHMPDDLRAVCEKYPTLKDRFKTFTYLDKTPGRGFNSCSVSIGVPNLPEQYFRDFEKKLFQNKHILKYVELYLELDFKELKLKSDYLDRLNKYKSLKQFKEGDSKLYEKYLSTINLNSIWR